MRTEPVSPSSQVTSSATTYIIPATSTATLSAGFPPVPVSSRLRTKGAAPGVGDPAFSVISISGFFGGSRVVSIFSDLFMITSETRWASAGS